MITVDLSLLSESEAKREERNYKYKGCCRDDKLQLEISGHEQVDLGGKCSV